MPTKISELDIQKITVTLPKALLYRLDEHVPPRGRSQFIAEAIEERLAIEEQLAVLDETAGVWREENHPEMAGDDDIERWLADVRRSWRPPVGLDHG